MLFQPELKEKPHKLFSDSNTISTKKYVTADKKCIKAYKNSSEIKELRSIKCSLHTLRCRLKVVESYKKLLTSLREFSVPLSLLADRPKGRHGNRNHDELRSLKKPTSMYIMLEPQKICTPPSIIKRLTRRNPNFGKWKDIVETASVRRNYIMKLKISKMKLQQASYYSMFTINRRALEAQRHSRGLEIATRNKESWLRSQAVIENRIRMLHEREKCKYMQPPVRKQDQTDDASVDRSVGIGSV